MRTLASGQVRARWRTPALALAAGAAVVADLVAAPSVLPTLEPSPATRPAAALPAGPTPIPGAGVDDLRRAWPYRLLG